uniref:Metallo-beta-lactamase domain-containing protein n=1 Tax=Parascaris equorum TaxID=6256 RepID=A0A914RUL4_PAREQ
MESIRSAVQSAGAELSAALVTHHHWDHAGETAGLSNSYGNRLAIYGGDDRISELTNKVKDGDTFKAEDLTHRGLNEDLDVGAQNLSGIGFRNPVLPRAFQFLRFLTSQLFNRCGRFFEGNAAEMHSALNEKLASLPDDTVRMLRLGRIIFEECHFSDERKH